MTSRGGSQGSGSGGDPFNNIIINASYCSILATVKDSSGKPISNIPVNCRDGSRWYNYTTNDLGMVLFLCNSGSANITTYNRSVVGGYYIFDQIAPATVNVDAVVGTKQQVNLNFNYRGGTIFIENNMSGNWKFFCTNNVFVQMVGAGGGGSYNCGGGGGAYNEANISIDKNTLYPPFIVGRRAAYSNNRYKNGNTGGTTSAMGIYAVGGTGGGTSSGGIGGGTGSFKGGNGGSKYRNGNPSAYANSSFNYGGGGGGGTDVSFVGYVNINYLYNSTWYNNITVYNCNSSGEYRVPMLELASNETKGQNSGLDGAHRVHTSVSNPCYYHPVTDERLTTQQNGSKYFFYYTVGSYASTISIGHYGGGGGGGYYNSNNNYRVLPTYSAQGFIKISLLD